MTENYFLMRCLNDPKDKLYFSWNSFIEMLQIENINEAAVFTSGADDFSIESLAKRNIMSMLLKEQGVKHFSEFCLVNIEKKYIKPCLIIMDLEFEGVFGFESSYLKCSISDGKFSITEVKREDDSGSKN